MVVGHKNEAVVRPDDTVPVALALMIIEIARCADSIFRLSHTFFDHSILLLYNITFYSI